MDATQQRKNSRIVISDAGENGLLRACTLHAHPMAVPLSALAIVEPLPRLLAGERIAHIEPVTLTRPAHMPDATDELCKLAGVERPEEVGTNGPVVASRVGRTNATHGELHLFEVVFGRDSLTVALILAEQFPALLEATVRYLAAFQGTCFNRFSEQEPGRIPHEIRNPQTDEIVRRISAESGWEWPFYGSVDATCLQVLAIEAAFHNRPGFLVEPGIADSLRAAADWILRRLTADPCRLLSSLPAFPGSITNQVWKDSPDSYSHQDGTLANSAAPVASLEVQALAHDALLAAAELLGQGHYARAAARLALQVEKLFWLPGENFYALAVDHDPATGAPRPLAVRASNMGWLLRSRLLERHPQAGERARVIAATLASEELSCNHGLRTLASDEVRYRPRGYHNGTVWLFDSYLASDGLARHGFIAQAAELRQGLLHACLQTHSFPEFVCGDDTLDPIASRIIDLTDAQGTPNRVEQPPQEIQAWTVAAAIACAQPHTRLA